MKETVIHKSWKGLKLLIYIQVWVLARQTDTKAYLVESGIQFNDCQNLLYLADWSEELSCLVASQGNFSEKYLNMLFNNALHKDYTELAKVLLEKGADPHINGNYPLAHAIYSGNHQLKNYLLSNYEYSWWWHFRATLNF